MFPERISIEEQILEVKKQADSIMEKGMENLSDGERKLLKELMEKRMDLYLELQMKKNKK